MSKKKFENMTEAKQRVAIAEDVLKQIHARKIKAMSGAYIVKLTTLDGANPGKNCRACALGALFVSKYTLSNGEWVEPQQEYLRGALSPYFSADQLRDIEQAFESDRWWTKWGGAFSNDEDRLIAIMQNIIDHKGTFKPKVEYEMV